MTFFVCNVHNPNKVGQKSYKETGYSECLIKRIGFTKVSKGEVCIQAKWPIWPALITVSVIYKSDWEYFNLLSPGWDGSPLQGYPQHKGCHYSLIHLSGERYCESTL